MSIEITIFRTLLSLLLSSIIVYEREINHSNAGLKTHVIVGVSATMIALIQANIVNESMIRVLANPALGDVIKSDPGRVIAQVVSGVGFLGAGTIIVTKRNISGLTTAASIWFIASLGISIGMGYYDVALSGFVVIILLLFISKKFMRFSVSRRLVIKYVGNEEVQDDIQAIFFERKLESKIIKFDMDMFHDQKIFITTYETDVIDDASFDRLIEDLSKHDQMISVQLTNI